jgi:hypothetical protein
MGGTSAFLAMPAVVFLLSRYTTGVYVARYTLWAEIGIAVLVTALVYVRARSNIAVGAALFMAYAADRGTACLCAIQSPGSQRE